MKKKILMPVVLTILAILGIFAGTDSIGYNEPNHQVMIIQFGHVIDVKTEPGVFFKIPFIQKAKDIYVGERLYDVPKSEVITSDKKSMTANCYVTWSIDNALEYYQNLSSESVAQGRIDVAVYNAMKNEISSTSQENVINGKDGSLSQNILKKISSLPGITINEIEMKQLDLPGDNKSAVYNRMISEREAIAAEYTANGDRDSRKIKSATDTEVRQIISNAQVEAAETEAEGEKLYFQSLANAYSASPDRQDFYNFLIGLDALKNSLANGGTMVIDDDSPLYSVLINQQSDDTTE